MEEFIKVYIFSFGNMFGNCISCVHILISQLNPLSMLILYIFCERNTTSFVCIYDDEIVGKRI